MESAPRPGVVIAFAAVIAACVAAVVGGMTALVVTQFDGLDGEHEPDAVALDLGAPQEIELTTDAPVVRCEAELPQGTIGVHLHATSGGGPIALRGRIGPAHHGAWDAETNEDAEEQDLDVAVPDLEPGETTELVVEIEALRLRRPDDSLVVTLESLTIVAESSATIDAGGTWSGTTTRRTGFRRTVAVRVPPGTEALRIDLDGAPCDLDVIAHTTLGRPWANRDADHEPTSATAEWLVLDRTSSPPVPEEGGTIFVTVVDPTPNPYDVPFRIVTTIGRDAPAELTVLPQIPLPTDPRERAIASVVELVTDGGGGSGTLIGADGLILTAQHVVEAAALATLGGRADEAPEIVVAMSLDVREPARDLFLAEVVHADRELDLALLRIVSGVRGNELPDGLEFPFVKLRRRSAIYLGETLWSVGFPAAGGAGTRAPLTLARGCVGGWTRAAKCNQIKTDAFVSPGSSGGAVFDDRWELVGVPVSTQDGGNVGTVLGNLVPVEAIPPAWLSR